MQADEVRLSVLPQGAEGCRQLQLQVFKLLNYLDGPWPWNSAEVETLLGWDNAIIPFVY